MMKVVCWGCYPAYAKSLSKINFLKILAKWDNDQGSMVSQKTQVISGQTLNIGCPLVCDAIFKEKNNEAV